MQDRCLLHNNCTFTGLDPGYSYRLIAYPYVPNNIACTTPFGEWSTYFTKDKILLLTYLYMLTVFILLTECYSFSSLFVRYILSK